jgi:hypothetical protein
MLAEHELEAEEKEKKLEERIRQFQAVLGPQAMEANRKALEDLQAEHHAGVQRIAAWAGKASTTLVPLGMSPIPVLKLPASIFDALPVLDSAADRLWRLDQILGARLEAEGGRLIRAVIEYILTCFRSHDLAISLEPVIAGPVAATEDAAGRAYKTSWSWWPSASSATLLMTCRVVETKQGFRWEAGVINFDFM